MQCDVRTKCAHLYMLCERCYCSQNRTDSLQSSIQHWSSVFQLLTHLQTAQFTEAQGIFRILSSRIVTRSIKPSLTLCGTSELTESLLPFIATRSRKHSHGISLVYLKFSTRDTLLQMYSPDIQHTPKETS